MGGRWHTFVDGFSCSAVEFYAAVETAVRARQIPGLSTERFLAKEGGAFSANREYLRIERERTAFDLCAAPFGGGFFFSWWRYRLPPPHPFLALFGVFFAVLVGGAIAMAAMRNSCLSVFAMPVGMLAVLVALGLAARQGLFGAEEDIVALPILGWFYERSFNPQTMYRQDTAAMFEHLVGLVVREEINKLLTQQGLRVLGAGPTADASESPPAA